jgi:hypothetical protein
MNQLDDLITMRLLDAAERVAVDPDLDGVVGGRHPAGRRPTHGSRWLVTVAAAVMVVVAAAGTYALGRRSDPGGSALDSDEEPLPMVPVIDDPPEWTGAFTVDWRTGGPGPRAVAVVGQVTEASIDNPILVELGTGIICETPADLQDLDDFEGHQACSRRGSPGWVHLDAGPGVTAEGAVDVATLRAVAEGARQQSAGLPGAFSLDVLPPGYTVVGGPVLIGVDRFDGVVATDVDAWIWSVPDVQDPIVALAAEGVGGGDFVAVDVNGIDGWYSQITNVELLAWSPEPGVVFMIWVLDRDGTLEQLVDLAERVRAEPAVG